MQQLTVVADWAVTAPARQARAQSDAKTRIFQRLGGFKDVERVVGERGTGDEEGRASWLKCRIPQRVYIRMTRLEDGHMQQVTTRLGEIEMRRTSFEK